MKPLVHFAHITLFTLLGFLVIEANDSQVVRVGAFNFYPAIFQDVDGSIKGFYVDALKEIEQKENIRFEYVYGTWSEGLDRIKNGEIDLLTSVAYSPERAKLLEYGTVPLLTVWGELYVSQTSRSEGLDAVRDKKIAVVTHDMNAQNFKELVQKLGLQCEYVEKGDMEEVFKAIASGEVDAGVVSNTFGVAKHDEYTLVPSGLVFNPFDIYFAVRKGKNSDLLKRLDNYLTVWHHEPNSVHNVARLNWSRGTINAIPIIPQWLWVLLVVIAGVIVIGLLFIFILKKQVFSKTNAVIAAMKQNQLLSERQKVLLAAIPDIVMEVNTNKKYTWANDAGRAFFGDDVLGKDVTDYFDGEQDTLDFIQPLFENSKEVIYVENFQRRKDGAIRLLGWWSRAVFDDTGKVVSILSTARDITNQKQIEVHLRKAKEVAEESGKRYRGLVNNLNAGVVVHDANSAIILSNPRAALLLGLSDDQMAGKLAIDPEWMFLRENGEPLPFEEYPVNQILRTHKSIEDYVLGINRPSTNDIVLVSVNGVPVFDNKGTLIEVIISFIDITEHKQIEKALLESEYFFKETQKAALIGSYQIALNSQDFWKTSTVYDQIFGIDEGYEKTLQGWMDLLHPADARSTIDYMLHEVMGKGAAFDKEYRIIRHSDGAPRWVWGRGQTLTNEAGIPTGLIGTIQDVTARKEAEAEVLKLTAAVEQSLNGVALTDLDGVVTYCNHAWASMHGYTRNEVLGKHLSLFHSPEQVNKDVQPAIVRLHAQGFIADAEIGHRRKDGTLFSTNMNITLVKDATGSPCGILGIAEDSTEKKAREVEKKKLQEQLHQSQKMESVGQLAGGVAHDFNNALGGIIGASEMVMSEDNLSEKQRRFLNMIITTAERAGNLTKKLLVFSRIGKETSAPMDMFAIAEDTVALLKQTVDKSITITLDNRAHHTRVMGDEAQLQNTLMNLGINAWHAMPNGGDLTFTFENVDLDDTYCEESAFNLQPGRYLEIAIRDTGCGMPSEVVSHIFEPFFTTKDQGKGTGLGLAMVYGTVQEHGGALTVYSEVDLGTVFRILLPIISEAPNQKTAEAAPLKGSGTILVVDDEEIIRITASTILEMLGYKVMVASNGQDAVALFEKEKDAIDLVILDMIMPIMGGRDAFKKLREMKDSIPVIIASGFAKDEHINELKKLGIQYFLNKPFRKVDLAKMVSEVLSTSNGE